MVRMIVGTMIQVGKHKLTLQEFEDIIKSNDCRNAEALAPACGLYLAKVKYPETIWIT
jgi:tRNA pseudouridine38-40 synthase